MNPIFSLSALTPMKVLLIDVYNYYRGGAETVYFNTGALLEEAGHEVVYFTLKWDENIPSPYSDYFPESKGTRRGVFRQFVNLVNYFYHFEAARNLEKLIDIEKPDIAHVHLIWGQLTSSILRSLKKKGVPTVLTAHDYRIVCPAYAFRDGKGEICEKCRGKQFYNCFFRKCSKGKVIESGVMALEQYFRNLFFHPARMIDGVIFVSDFSKKKHLEYMPELSHLPIMTLYNMSQISDNRKSFDDGRYFLYFGRLSAEKGVRTLVDAFINAPCGRLKIAGSGPLENELRSLVNESNADNIEFLGFKRGADLNSLIENAAFIIVPSECYENNPMAIVEGNGLGVPVIGSRIGGIPEIIEEGKTGFMFEPGDSKSLVAVVEKVVALTDEGILKMGCEAQRFAREHFGIEQYRKRLMGFYNEVIESNIRE